MNYSKISVRYAKALFSLAKEKKMLDDIKADAVFLYHSFETIPEINNFLCSPIIPDSIKRKIIQELFKDEIHTYSLSFLYLLINNKREEHILHIFRDFIDMYKKEKNILSVVLTIPVSIDKPLEDEISTMIKNRFTGDIELIKKIDEKIIGGFIANINNQLFDASIASYLKRIKQELIETPI